MLTAFGELPNLGERGLVGQGLGMNLCLLIFNCRIFASRVERGIPSLEAQCILDDFLFLILERLCQGC
jgi:hypothetical protein